MPHWGCAALPKGSVYVQVMLTQALCTANHRQPSWLGHRPILGAFTEKHMHIYICLYIETHIYTHRNCTILSL